MDSLKNMVSSVAPFIGNMVGGPLGGATAKFLGNLLLGDDNASEEDIKNAIKNATPEQLVELKRIDSEERIKAAGLQKEREALFLQDRQDARNFSSTIAYNTSRNVAYIVMIGFFATLITLMLVEINTKIQPLIDAMIGFLGASLAKIVDFFYGSSLGSKIKSMFIEQDKNNKLSA